MMAQGVMGSPVILVIKAPNQKYDDQTINCYQNWTVEKLKAHLSDVYPSKPRSKDQRLVYSGKLLLDHFTLKDVLRKQDEYHMLHLVCPSPTPPSSPGPARRHINKPQENATGPAVAPTASPSFPGQSEDSSDGLRQQDGYFPYHQLHQQFIHSWSQLSATSTPPTNVTTYYNHMTLMWWQQLYARQHYMHYQSLATSSPNLSPDLPRTSSVPQSRQAQANRRGNPEVEMNAQGGEMVNEEELNQDWLDWVYTFSRTAILLSIVYFYSSFSHFLLVMTAMLVLYLQGNQPGWFPFNFENELQLPGDGANQEEMEADLQENDPHETDAAGDDSTDDDDEGDSGEEGAEDPNVNVAQTGFLSSTWSFVITFFMSLIPEGAQNAAN